MSRKLGTGNLARLNAMSRGALAVFAEPEQGVRMVYPDVDWIEANPDQPRRRFDPAELEALTESIRKYGLQQPIGVRELGPSRFQLVFGERRLRAVRALGQQTVPCILVPDGVDTAEVAVVENVLRADLTPFEEADAFVALVEKHNYSHADLAQIMGRDRAEITKTIALTKVSAAVRECYEGTPKKVARYKLYQIAALDEPEEQMRLWEALSSDRPAAGAPAPASGSARATAPRDEPEAVLSAFSLRVSRNILRTREALHAFQEKPKRLEDVDREVLRDLRSAIDAILDEEPA
ncbi:ParB/RepB/Spo0J family partition protein [Azospirillum rugosum]|uniref:ParB family chromosome partitioning protein n=1 Tax=Azospirillum rugosum TaxID=416170 RepID=A0ABS4SQ23_9PROT|nr:ParB/RepB/Spo0J family partition protein [Azospirillum rugosum]MBP2294334.1 ParB family chromosome partitioning protein [Azospirillum rugosum]MDQ0527669.1 ParB family chromosome partitioning protein [Azospirillum rugosum]